ncbi:MULTISPECIES: class I SAM-dependent methyltransferase [Pseudomonas]|jgi:phosphatidylethanolamine/phosphatidyl-N-methylethanolamine N-methyltransferase|uniref:Phosphatidylethanolamine/phosphatidyl-N-methylethanolamine N-methyltransferase n=1 Tax=Pseudomonas oryzihabitans TaxID=47885 RepID=A0A1G5PEZ2_9PSED|nr:MULTISPECIES: class I SAM-dependent methyltransferase [Pseudomonas]NMY91494.1 class I SAM-dependent methyltransferase [Pseudomonas psychrotolerans]NMZ44525.1 class I SAM-dependent methyltransferase [Pseudomonas oryzihabitans]SCZ47570.1 phosphatidylethanolamine/phosphatidyl-N-methylethanolamine N-methyltransferase [Pseudomonas psychrotolerans]
MHDSKKIDYSLNTADTSAPHSALDNAAIISAYRRWANVYDRVFGGVSAPGRKRAVAAVNALAGTRVLEVGVGTGLALPHYGADKRVTGIDLSPDMLAKARERVIRDDITTVDALLEANAEETGLPTGSFDIAVAMFVASVVPNPRKLMQEMRRVVKPGGHLLLVNHFQAESGLRLLAEKALAPASRKLGWHPDFAMDSILSREDLRRARRSSVPPCGLFTLVQLTND